jgi:hypothetical protein
MKQLLILSIVLLLGCATAPPRLFGGKISQNTIPVNERADPNIRRVYVHSFLELQTIGISRDSFHTELTTSLSNLGVASLVVDAQSKANSLGAQASNTVSIDSRGSGSSSLIFTKVAIGRILRALQPAEREYKATHRLILVPSINMSQNVRYETSINWDIEDISGRPLARGTVVFNSTFLSGKALAEAIVQYMKTEGLF